MIIFHYQFSPEMKGISFCSWQALLLFISALLEVTLRLIHKELCFYAIKQKM